jgi:hypothetical protein
MTDRSREAHAFIATVDKTEPQAVSACDGWTTHEVAAHVTGIAVEVIRHLDPFLQGDQVPRTRSFEEREAPLQAMDHQDLLGRLDAEGTRMRRLVDEVLDRGTATLAWASGDADEPSVELDAGARQLFIWGRRPDHRNRLRSHLTQPQLARLQSLLSGY